MPSDLPMIEARGLSKRYHRDRGRIVESMGMHHLLGELASMPWRAARRALDLLEVRLDLADRHGGEFAEELEDLEVLPRGGGVLHEVDVVVAA